MIEGRKKRRFLSCTRNYSILTVSFSLSLYEATLWKVTSLFYSICDSLFYFLLADWFWWWHWLLRIDWMNWREKERHFPCCWGMIQSCLSLSLCLFMKQHFERSFPHSKAFAIPFFTSSLPNDDDDDIDCRGTIDKTETWSEGRKKDAFLASQDWFNLVCLFLCVSFCVCPISFTLVTCDWFRSSGRPDEEEIERSAAGFFQKMTWKMENLCHSLKYLENCTKMNESKRAVSRNLSHTVKSHNDQFQNNEVSWYQCND